MPDKQQILDAITVIAKRLRHTPSRAEFISRSGISLHFILKWFPSWNHAVRAAKLRSYGMNVRLPDRLLLEDWGKAVRKNGAVPPRRVYLLEGKYNPGTLAKRFGGYSSMPDAFRNFAKGKRQWNDVVALLPFPPACGPQPKAKPRRPNNLSASTVPLLKTWHAERKDRTTYGNPTQFLWLRHEPTNEQGVVLLFGMLARDLGYLVENVQKGFPDCEAKRQVGAEKWQNVRIEFEFESKNFRDHGHPIKGCDVIVCWRHNWSNRPAHIEILELSKVIKSLANSEG